MRLMFAGETRGYTSEDSEEIVSVSPSKDGSVSFLVLKADGQHESWTLIYDAKTKRWRDEVERFTPAVAA